jgi:hypothetical protein
VRVDEARHDNHICRVDYLCPRRRDPCAHALDHPISNQHICARQSPLGWVYGYYGSIVDQISTALDVRRRTLGRCSANQSWSTKRCEGYGASQLCEISTFHCFLRFFSLRSLRAASLFSSMAKSAKSRASFNLTRRQSVREIV